MLTAEEIKALICEGGCNVDFKVEGAGFVARGLRVCQQQGWLFVDRRGWWRTYCGDLHQQRQAVGDSKQHSGYFSAAFGWNLFGHRRWKGGMGNLYSVRQEKPYVLSGTIYIREGANFQKLTTAELRSFFQSSNRIYFDAGRVCLFVSKMRWIRRCSLVSTKPQDCPIPYRFSDNG